MPQPSVFKGAGFDFLFLASNPQYPNDLATTRQRPRQGKEFVSLTDYPTRDNHPEGAQRAEGPLRILLHLNDLFIA